MSHAANVLRRQAAAVTSPHSRDLDGEVDLTTAQARALADLVVRAGISLPCLVENYPGDRCERWISGQPCANCAARDAVEAAFEAEP